MPSPLLIEPFDAFVSPNDAEAPDNLADELLIFVIKLFSDDGSSESLIFGLGLGFMTNLIVAATAEESGAAIGRPPLPSLLRLDEFFSEDAKPRGRIFEVDLGEA